MKKSLFYFSSQYSYYYFMSFLYFILIIIGMLVSVAFFTLFERKLLSYIHKRKGPNKASISGITQPFSDAMKLLSKEMLYSTKMKYSIYIFSPLMMMLITLILWTILPSSFEYISSNNSIILMLCCFSISVYPVMLGGWASHSNYALLGIMRGLAQSISYEVSMIIIIICPMILCDTFNFLNFYMYQKSMNLGMWLWPSAVMLYISSLAEVNRAPFDFIEGESELVSGFNIEYYGFGFAFIFLAEYSMIIWISSLNTIIFFPMLPFILSTLIYAYSMVWVRASFPRMRYDELMYLCWKVFLPLSILTLSSSMIYKYILIMNI